MKRIIIAALCILMLIPALCSCTKRMSQEEVAELVHNAIDEPVSFVKQEKSKGVVNYIFNLTDRNIEFAATSTIVDKKEVIRINYEIAIADALIEKRKELASIYGAIDEYTIGSGVGSIVIDDTETAANFITVLDDLYAFKENDNTNLEFVRCSLEYSDGTVLTEKGFSTSDNSRYDSATIKYELDMAISYDALDD